MDTIKKVPEIRFEGFYDEWKKKRVKEFAKIIGGGTPSTLNIQYWNGEINWYTPAEIDGKRYVGFSERKITHLGLQSCSATILPALKTVLFTSRAGIGKTAILKTDACTNQGFQSLVLNDSINADFIYSLSKKIKLEAEKIASGSTFTEISGKKLSEISVFLATEEEQLLVGNVFKNLDEKLELEKEKHEKLINFKKAMLEDMFPKEGERVTKVRFDGFDAEWGFELIKNLFYKKSAKSKVDYMINNGKFLIMDMGSVSETGNNISHKRTNFTEDMIDKEGLVMPKDDIGGGKIIGRTVYIGEGNKYVLSDHVYLLYKLTENIIPLFAHYQINGSNFNRKIKRITTGSAQLGISWTNVGEEQIRIPSPEEQALIGNFFKNLDEKIEISEMKIVKIENFKKAMLDKMFV